MSIERMGWNLLITRYIWCYPCLLASIVTWASISAYSFQISERHNPDLDTLPAIASSERVFDCQMKAILIN